jgi:RimJ/RimL family protein N-acetyltransferase
VTTPQSNSTPIHLAPDPWFRPVHSSLAPPEVNLLSTMLDRGAQAHTFTFPRAMPSDLSTIAEMIDRCSVNSRRRRFFRPLPSAPPGYLEEVLANPEKHHVFVVKYEGKTVGFAELHRVGPSCGSLALIIEDAHQHRGAGSAALQLLVRHAREIGLRTLVADLLFENIAVLRALRRVGSASVDMEDGIFHVEMDVESAREAVSDATRAERPPRQTVPSAQGCRTDVRPYVSGSCLEPFEERNCG